MSGGAGPRWTVLYDDDCGLCRWLLSILLGWDRAARLQPLALRRPQAAALLADLEPAERMGSWHLIRPDGRRLSAGAALPALLRLLPAGRLPAAVLELSAPATERGYRWVADHRSQLSRLVPAASKERGDRRVHERERRGA